MSSELKQLFKSNRHTSSYMEFEEVYLSHPNYPSLYAITDSLTMVDIDNVAAHIPYDQLKGLPAHFLASVSTKNTGHDLAFVSKSETKIMVSLEGKKNEVLTHQEFVERWNGNVLAIEENEKVQTKSTTSVSGLLWLAAGLVLLLGINWFQNTNVLGLASTTLYSVGFLFSILILQEKLNQKTAIGEKLCSLSTSTSCDSVLNSSGSKITSWLDFSDLPILFFGGALLSSTLDPSAFVFFNLLSLLTIPVIVYSIWLQKVKLKSYCVLCLTISSILIVQAAVGATKLFEFHFSAQILVGLGLFTSLYFFAKEFLFENDKLKNSVNELKRFKRNYQVFKNLQKPIAVQTQNIESSSIRIGTYFTPIHITLALSPSCGHCHSAFKDGISLYEKYPEKISLSILFNMNPNNEDNPYLIIAKSILEIYQYSPEMAIQALKDWHILKMEKEDWLVKWEHEIISQEVEDKLLKQYDWCMENNFNYTPAKIVNDQEFPKEYELNELKYFLTEMEEEVEISNNPEILQAI